MWESIIGAAQPTPAKLLAIAFPAMADSADYYREIYMRGLGGETPAVPVSIAELERQAIAAMEPRAANYVGAGAGSEDTIRANAEAFRAHRIVPRMLRDVAARDLSTTVLGTAMPAPLMLAPIGVQKVVHEEGELATARAAAAVGAPMIASTASHFSLEEIAAAGGASAPRWFQLYWANDRELVESFVGRAERAGYGAIVVTVDTFVPGWKPRDLQQAWLPFLNGMGIANYFQDPVFRAGLEQPPEEDLGAATGHFLGIQANPSLTWDDLAWLRELTSLPILVKGIQHVDDAREAARRGARRHRRLQPRRPPGRRRDRLARRPGADRRGGRRRAGDPLRQRRPQRRRRAQGARPRRRRRLPRPPLRLGPGAGAARPGVETVLKMVLAELDLTMALCGLTRPDQLGPDCRRLPQLVNFPSSARKVDASVGPRSSGRAAGSARRSGRRGASPARPARGPLRRARRAASRCSAAGRGRAAASSPAAPRPGCRGLRRGARGRPRPWPAPRAGSPRRSG